MKRVEATAEGISEAALLIRSGSVAAYPTETVYGLGVDPFSNAAVARLYAVKQRPETNAVLLIAADLAQITLVVREIPEQARPYIETYWPGPLSLLLPARDAVARALLGGGENVCVRVTSNRIARALCRAVGHPITSTSANIAGATPARSLDEVRLDGVAIGINGGTLKASEVSTVFDPQQKRVLREGAIPRDVLER